MIDTFYKVIQDPGWWITTIFFGLAIGVLSNFLKDWISKLLSVFFSYYKIQYQRSKQMRENEINIIASDQALLLIKYVESSLWGMGVLGVELTLIAVMITVDIEQFSDFGKTLYSIYISVGFISSIVAMYWFIHHLRLGIAAKKRYSKHL